MTIDTYWYNYDIKEYQLRSAPITADEAKPLLPDVPSARNLFALYVEMRDSVLESMRKTLLACVGESTYPVEA